MLKSLLCLQLCNKTCIAMMFSVMIAFCGFSVQAQTLEDQTQRPLEPKTLKAYEYAFKLYSHRMHDKIHMHAGEMQQNDATEEALRNEMMLSNEQFAAFKAASVSYYWKMLSSQAKLESIANADRASHLAMPKLSSQAKAQIHDLLDEVIEAELSAIRTIDWSLDKSGAEKIETAVMNLFQQRTPPVLLPNYSPNRIARFSSQGANHSGIRTMSTSGPGGGECLDPILGDGSDDGQCDGGSGYIGGGGSGGSGGGGSGNACYDPDPDGYNTITPDECEEDGGVYNLETCTCYIGPTPGGGGGGPTTYEPEITSITPSILPVGSNAMQVTINGSGFSSSTSEGSGTGASPTLNFATGVSYTIQSASNTQITALVSIPGSVPVSNATFTLTANALTSNAVAVIYDGPYQLVVVKDVMDHCLGCKTTVKRSMTYQIQNLSGTNAGTTTICEIPVASTGNCSKPINLDPNWCPNNPSGFTSNSVQSFQNGQYTDGWSLDSDTVSPVGCGLTVNDPWYWLSAAPTLTSSSSTAQELGRPNGFVHTNAVQINGVTRYSNSDAAISTGTVMPK